MKRIKIVGLCLVAVFAFSAVATATASASERPEFKKCGNTPKVGKKLPTGEFSNKECTDAQAEGKYRLEEVAEGTPFTSKSKAVTINADGKVVKCSKSTGTGAITSQFTESASITFEKCGVNGSSKAPCGTGGDITTGALTGSLFFANAEENEAVIALDAEGGAFAEFKCGAETIVLEGVLVGTIKNSKSGETLTFAVEGGHQAVQGADVFGEEVSGLTLTSGGNEATLATIDEQKNSKEGKGIGVFPS